MSAMEAAIAAAEDGVYQVRAAMRQLKHLQNEQREAMLTDAELAALFDAYNEAGR